MNASATDCHSRVATETQPGATVDWAEMRALYCKGISLSDLSRKFGISLGTIKARSSREKWATTVAKVNEHVIQAATRDLQASATHWISRIDQLVHQSLVPVELELAKGGEVKLKDLQVILDCAERANRIARANYGLDKEQANNRPTLALQVNVNGKPSEPEVRYTSLQLDQQAS